jgi:hypothetical protein
MPVHLSGSRTRGPPVGPIGQDGAVRRRHRLRRTVNAVTLATPLGLLLAVTGRARLRPGPDGTLLAVGYRSPFPAPHARAVTIGDVVLVRMDADELARLPGLLRHEVRHTEQWARLLGLVGFPVAYGLASAWSRLRVGDAATANVFEVAAGLVDGGYRAAAQPGDQPGDRPGDQPE